MQIGEAQIPMGPGAYQAVAELLQSQLRPDEPGFTDAVRQLAARVDRDAGRLPWTKAALAWMESQQAVGVSQTLHTLNDFATAGSPLEVARGAALLLVAIAERRGGVADPLLFDLVATAREPEVQRLVGAYLLATARTRGRALTDLETVPVLSDLVKRQQGVQESLDLWRHLVSELAAESPTPYAEVVLHQIETRPDLQFDLENGCLDVFERATKEQQAHLVRFWLDVLEHRGERLQLFVCDLLSSPVFLESARAEMGYRLERLVRRLEQTAASPQTRQYAAALLTRLETSATASLEMAARGRWNLLDANGQVAIDEALVQAISWFCERDVATMACIRGERSWDVSDYAHAALQVLGPEPRFPLALDELCEKLGVYLQGLSLPAELDGLFIQRPGLPGPVVLYNQSSGVSRRRFTIAHELGHALLPGHAVQTFHLSSVVEAGEPAVLDPLEIEVAATTTHAASGDIRWEREADRFAAALLMPPRWFGPAVQSRSFTLQELRNLAHSYGASLTAAAFQAVRHTQEAVALVYSEGGRVRYQRMTDQFRDLVGADAEVLHRIRPGTGAAEILEGNEEGPTRQVVVPAALWMSGASLTAVREESQQIAAGTVLSIIAPAEDDGI